MVLLDCTGSVHTSASPSRYDAGNDTWHTVGQNQVMSLAKCCSGMEKASWGWYLKLALFDDGPVQNSLYGKLFVQQLKCFAFMDTVSQRTWKSFYHALTLSVCIAVGNFSAVQSLPMKFISEA